MSVSHRILSIVFTLITFVGYAQQKISIEDPEFTVGMEIPESWTSIDDGYVLKILPGDTAAKEYMTFTYFADAGKVTLDTALFIETNFKLTKDFPGYKQLAIGDTKMNKHPGKWVNFMHGNKDRQKACFYISLQNGQSVQFLLNASAKKFDTLLPAYQQVIKSFVMTEN